MVLQSMTDVLLDHREACVGSVSRVLSLPLTKVDSAMALTLNDMLLHSRIPAPKRSFRTRLAKLSLIVQSAG